MHDTDKMLASNLQGAEFASANAWSPANISVKPTKGLGIRVLRAGSVRLRAPLMDVTLSWRGNRSSTVALQASDRAACMHYTFCIQHACC